MARKASKAKAKTARKTSTRKSRRVAWSAANVKELRGYSKSKTPVAQISRAMKRTAGALRQKARTLGIALGHRR